MVPGVLGALTAGAKAWLVYWCWAPGVLGVGFGVRGEPMLEEGAVAALSGM